MSPLLSLIIVYICITQEKIKTCTLWTCRCWMSAHPYWVWSLQRPKRLSIILLMFNAIQAFCVWKRKSLLSCSASSPFPLRSPRRARRSSTLQRQVKNITGMVARRWGNRRSPSPFRKRSTGDTSRARYAIRRDWVNKRKNPPMDKRWRSSIRLSLNVISWNGRYQYLSRRDSET